jgi:hypothetical protein
MMERERKFDILTMHAGEVGRYLRERRIYNVRYEKTRDHQFCLSKFNVVK